MKLLSRIRARLPIAFSEVGFYVLLIAQKHRILSSLYVLFSGRFSEEHYAVVKGRFTYHASLRDFGASSALLRRNIHRLEKGLIMRPRREVFAEGFIIETVKCYQKAVSPEGNLDYGEVKWATDVLDEYFSVVGDTQTTVQAAQIYKPSRLYLEIDSLDYSVIPASDFKPYSYRDIPSHDIKFEDLKRLMISRRSVRWFAAEHVSTSLVQSAANIASLAPSACNRQPYRFLFCNDKNKAVSIAKCAGGTVGFAENVPAIIVVVGDLSAYPFERDRHLIYIDGSLGAMQLMLALQTLGLSTCCINWPDLKEPERRIRRIIELQEHERILMLLAVGYAKDFSGIPFSQKKINDHILEDIS